MHRRTQRLSVIEMGMRERERESSVRSRLRESNTASDPLTVASALTNASFRILLPDQPWGRKCAENSWMTVVV